MMGGSNMESWVTITQMTGDAIYFVTALIGLLTVFLEHKKR